MLTFSVIIYLFPLISIVIGIVGYFLFKKLSTPVTLVVLIIIIVALIWSNRAFGGWMFIYAMIACVAAFLTKLGTAKIKSKKP
ncbi:hypothetical protein ACTNEO_01015 [Gracilibacillus sp. HCP3S3_G5_1]|uniref:hypothetical protein n=1 Tax=unclassified Gracilibacillus TaxID=2625209 RepID=UPI003F89C0AA